MKLYNLKKNLYIWSPVTILSATPSFIVAIREDMMIIPMLVGIIVVMTAYILFNSTKYSQDFLLNNKYFAKALKIAFILRIVLSILILAQFLSQILVNTSMNAMVVIDLLLGAISVEIVSSCFGGAIIKTNFTYILLTTFMQALLVSLSVLFIAFIIWCFIRIFIYLKP